jgi:hypothetical protein
MRGLHVWVQRFERDAHQLLLRAALPRSEAAHRQRKKSARHGLISRVIEQTIQLSRVAQLDLIKPTRTFGV